MKLAVLQENLKRALSYASRAVVNKSPLPALTHILLDTDNGRLNLTGNNFEIAIMVSIAARVEKYGEICIPAKLLSDLVGNLPNDTVDLDVDPRTQTLTVQCRGTKASIKGIDADEFPSMPSLGDNEPVAELPPELLREVITQVSGAAAAEHTNPILQGVLLRINGDQATFAATDGYRLAVRTVQLPASARENVELVLPAKAMQELGRILGDSEQPVSLTVTPSGGQAMFHTDTIDFVSRVIDGKFFDYERFIPPSTNSTTRTVLSTAEFLRAVKRVALFSQAAGNIVTLTMEGGSPGRLTLNANAAEIGESVECVDALIDGDDGKLALNVRYLQEALGTMPTDQVALESQTPNSPGVFKPIGGDEYLHLIMPMMIPPKFI